MLILYILFQIHSYLKSLAVVDVVDALSKTADCDLIESLLTLLVDHSARLLKKDSVADPLPTDQSDSPNHAKEWILRWLLALPGFSRFPLFLQFAPQELLHAASEVLQILSTDHTLLPDSSFERIIQSYAEGIKP